MNHKLKRTTAGYTLIELMLVVVILSILASIVIPRYGGVVIKAHQAKAKSNLGTLRTVINIYYSEMEGHYPLQQYPTGTDHYVNDSLSLSAILAPKWIDKVPIPVLRTPFDEINGVPGNWDTAVNEAMLKAIPDDVYIYQGPRILPLGFYAPYLFDNEAGMLYIPNGDYDYSGNGYFSDW